jgi:hypothetical protein
MSTIRPLTLMLAATVAVAACSQKSGDQGQSAPATPAPAAAPASPAPATPAPTAALPRQKAPDGTTVSFVDIKNGDTVTSPFKVGFAVTGARIAPAGTTEAGTGHFHLIIDSDLPPQDGPLPASEHVKHYGKGQTEDTLTLPPGSHTLQIELADGAHVPFDPPVVSDKITVTVK